MLHFIYDSPLPLIKIVLSSFLGSRPLWWWAQITFIYTYIHRSVYCILGILVLFLFFWWNCGLYSGLCAYKQVLYHLSHAFSLCIYVYICGYTNVYINFHLYISTPINSVYWSYLKISCSVSLIHSNILYLISGLHEGKPELESNSVVLWLRVDASVSE
jgi:hypothetical protein